MKLLELNEDELNLFINNSQSGEDIGLVKLLEVEKMDCDAVVRMIIDRVNK